MKTELINNSRAEPVPDSDPEPLCHAGKPTVRARRKTALLFVFALLSGTAAQAQGYVLESEFATQQNIVLATDRPLGIKNYWQRQYSGHLDMNADGIDDLVIIHEDQQGTPVEMVVVDMVTREQIWSWADDNGVPVDKFMGFADIDGDLDLKEPVFILGGDGIHSDTHTLMIINPDTKTAEFEIIGILVALIEDLDDDGLHELVVMVDVGDVLFLQTWGAGEAGQARR
ncbi:MAG: hypothetical protein ACE5G0_13635 [Rhodothermales bacterium]